MIALGKKVLTGACRLTSADLLAAAKEPWEEAFSQQRCLQAWESIGVSPFNEKVYWDLRAAEANAKKVATANEVNPELLTLKGMVGIMYGVEEQQPSQSSRRRKRDVCLHSSDLWDLPGGATGDECYSIVKAKTEAKQAKVAATRAAKAQRVEGKQQKRAASLVLGSQVVASLCHDAHVAKLKLPALVAALAFKGVDVPAGTKKAALIELLRAKLNLPCDGVAPPLADDALHVVAEPAAEPVVEHMAPNVDDESGSDGESYMSDDDAY